MKTAKMCVRTLLVIMFLIVGATVCLSVSATSVNGAVILSRSNTSKADSNKYAKIVFYEQGTKKQVGSAVPIENPATVGTRIIYSVNVASGNYDMAVEKAGYLPYVVENMNVLSTYTKINLPDMTLVPGDLNVDRNINMTDIVLSLRAFDVSSAFDLVRSIADINEDGFSVTDLGLIKNANNFGKTSAQLSTMQFSTTYAQTNIPTLDSHYLIDDSSFTTRNTNDNAMIQSGWNFDNQGGPPNLTDSGPYLLNDISADFGVRLVRYITTQYAGTMTLETSASITSGGDGFYYQFISKDGKTAYKLVTDDGYFNLYINGVKTKLNLTDSKGSYTFKIVLNLDNQTARTLINSVDYGTYGFNQTVTDINELVIGTSKEDLIYATPSYVQLYSNYAVNERFTQANDYALPNDWTKTVSSGNAYVLSDEMFMNLTASGSAMVQKTFTAVSGNVCFETLFMLPSLADGAIFKLMSGTKVGVSVKTLNNDIYSNTTKLRDYYLANMWYLLRIEADTRTGQAIIKINGKTLGTVAFENSVSSFDSIKVELAGTTARTLKFDETMVYAIPDVTDYVPVPQVPSKTSEKYVGINVCSLWRNGEHWGWDNITAFDEVKPLLGYYDEGIPEEADWEIKFLSEHGIDYQSFCWYSSQSNAPIKTTRLSGAIHHGFMNAKYSNKMKFALLWEAANASHPSSSAAFRNYFVPYWMEYFFSDPRYMVIENKPVISVFGYGQLITDFGSEANVAAELEYVRTQCKSLGYSGAIFIACCSSTTASELQKVANCGFDAVQAYNWGKNGYDPTSTKNYINAQYSNESIIHVIPTVSTGFNNVGWGGTRSPNMSVADFASMMLWVKDTALPRNDASSWKSKLAILSTWNEYGEGTYMMPSGLNGFGYMDGVRAAYTTNLSHTDDVPTANQLSRLGYMIPQNRALIRPLQRTNATIPTGVKSTWNFVQGGAVSTDWYYSSMSTPYVNGSGITATATGTDPIITMKNDCNVDISAVSYIKVRMNGPAGNGVQVFYTTDSDATWTEEKSITATISSSGMIDYYLPVYSKTTWAGTLKKLRIDPINNAATFSIESITLLYDPHLVNVLINGSDAPLWCNPVYTDGHYMIPMVPDTGIFYYFNSYFEWDKANKVLYMAANNHEITFTMGSATAVIDGVATALGSTPYLLDGVPMLPIDALVNAFKYQMTISDGVVSVTTPWKPYYDVLNNAAANTWEFNFQGFPEGWTFGNMNSDISVTGAIGGAATNNDPILYSPNLDITSGTYSKITVGMKNSGNTAGTARIFYQLNSSSDWLAAQNIIGTPTVTTSNSNFVEYTFSLSGISGTITNIRLDPFESLGSFYVDYIRFNK